MKVNYNPTSLKNCLFEDIIQTQVNLFLNSESNTYVVFDGTSQILCEGTLATCYVYKIEFEKTKDYSVAIYAKECYNKMMEKRYDTER